MKKRVISYIIYISGVLLLAGFTMPVTDQDDEFMLTFRHPAVGGYYVSAIHSGDMVYLPVAELLSLLYIHNEKGATGFSLKGTYPDDTPWELDPGQLMARSGRSDYTLSPEDIRIGAMDVFLAPEIFEQLFGLVFTVNLSALSLSLQSEHPLPVEDRNKRDRLRRDLERRRSDRPDYPLYFPRDRKLFGAGMLDYSLGVNLNNAGESMNYNILGGLEFLGGDLQGGVNGFVSENNSRTNMSNLHWRYALHDNPWLTSVRAGQMLTTGLQNRRIIGGAITNDPIMPRRIYDTYVIDGNTVPDSEVELYVNNQLSDFTRADELGYYRFDYPLNYGTARISTRIYTPSGQIIVEEKQMQIPFTFLPRGVMTYNIQGGYVDENMGFETSDLTAMHSDVAYGVTNGLTVKIGTDYLSSEEMPLYYGSISTRIFSQYLFNIDAAPGNFYRSNFSVTFPNNRSFNINYTEYEGADRLYYANMNRDMGANLYLPVRLFGNYSGFRFGGEHRILQNNNKITNYRLDFNTRMGRTNLRMNFRESIRGTSEDITNYDNSLATASVTYYLSRTPGLPVFIRGMFVRVQADYAVRSNELWRTGIQLSRSIPRRGRFQVNADYDFRHKALLMQGTLSIDLQPLRSSTQMTVQSRQYNFTQNFTGSLALDAGHKQVVTSNRNQVGQSAASIRMFVDANENGLFDPGEEIVPSRAVRLDQGATIHLGKDSIQRISQIQSYWRYNAEIVQSALPNPMLAPLFTEFSFEADPNRYKPIDIPLYRTGVIEGLVRLNHTDGKQHGLGGLRLILKHATSEKTETLRSFSDGGFYAMNLLPGHYTLEVDPIQLSFLNAKSEPEKINFEIKALSNGDYIEGLNIILIANEPGAAGENDNQQTRVIEQDTAHLEAVTPALPDDISGRDQNTGHIIMDGEKPVIINQTKEVHEPSLPAGGQIEPSMPAGEKHEAARLTVEETDSLTQDARKHDSVILSEENCEPAIHVGEWFETLTGEAYKHEDYVPFLTILFGFDSYRLTDTARYELDKLHKLMTRFPSLQVGVTGYTDAIGSCEYNLQLSRNRSLAVVNYLVSKGIPSGNIFSRGAGKTGFAAINFNADGTDNPEGRRFNRRAEIDTVNAGDENIILQDLHIPKHLKAEGPYTVQLLALSKPMLSDVFHPSDAVTMIEGSDGLYRYISGLFTSYKEAQKTLAGFVKRGFTDAFIRQVPGHAGVSRSKARQQNGNNDKNGSSGK